MNCNYELYCLNYKNLDKKIIMEERFKKLDISYNFYEGVDDDDQRIKNKKKKYGKDSSADSIMFGHLDMIYKFYNDTDKSYGIFCEDDIYIHKNFKDYLPKIIEDFESLNLDILLLGYLITHKISDSSDFGLLNKEIIFNDKYKYYKYHNDLWGTQMYMLSRNNAKKILDKYYYTYLDYNPQVEPFSSDWTITKFGNRALVFPLLAVEDGKKTYDHRGQHDFHFYSYFNNYNQEEFI
jgi:hypothetical protein